MLMLAELIGCCYLLELLLGLLVIWGLYEIV